jgi:hypothetical protein
MRPERSQLATEAIIYWTDTFWPAVLASGPCRSAGQILLFREPGGEWVPALLAESVQLEANWRLNQCTFLDLPTVGS